jgi:uncharacterized protein with HEPN domain
MSARSVGLLLEDVWEAIEKIERFLAGFDHDTFLRDERTVDAVVRNLEIVGEACSRLPLDFRSAHPEIEWRRISGLRNRIVHDYFGIDLEIVWAILKRELPELKDKIRALRFPQ